MFKTLFKTHWERPWCWERLKVGGEGDDRGWDGWMASPTQWTRVWVSSGNWWWTGRPGVPAVHGVAKSRTQLSDFTFSFSKGLPVHHQLPEITQTHVHRVGNVIQPSHPLSSPSPLAFLFEWVSGLIRWPKYWSFSFSISPSNEYSGLISFRMDWLDLLAVQGTLKGLLQHHGSKASVLWHSAFFIVQLSHPYMTAGKTVTLTRWTLAK